MVISPVEATKSDWNIYLQIQTGIRAAEILRIFGQAYATPAVQSAGELYGAYLDGVIDEEDVKRQRVSLAEDEFKQIWGIATDFPVLNDYIQSHNNHPRLHSAQLTEQEVTEEISNLLRLGKSINLETVLIGAAYNLALMDTYNPQSREAQAALSQAEFIYASLCEIIGFDGLAMALRSRVECIRLYNTGHDHIVSESERIAMSYQDKDGNYAPLFNHFVDGILSETVGPCSHEPVLTADPMHGIVIEEGACDQQGLRVVARLKSVGSRASKLLRNLEKHNAFEINMDDVGITLVAQDDEHLATSYIAMIEKMLLSEKVSVHPSPSRTCEFHISGDRQFVDYIRSCIVERFPLEHESFEFIADTTGFNVAKATGFYEDQEGCVAFETQVLTQQGRKDSRSGRSAHVFYKFMRFFGKRYIPDDEQIAAIAEFNSRKEHMGTNGLCPASEARYNQFVQTYA